MSGNLTVAVSVSEVLEELKEDLVFSLLSRLDFRVHAAVVDTSEIGSSDGAIAVSIKLKEGLVNHGLSLGVEGSADANEELIEVNMTIAISIEQSHESISLLTGNLDLDLAESGVELFGIDLVVSIEGVEVSEGSSETSDCLGTTCVNLSFDFLENYTLKRHGLGSLWVLILLCALRQMCLFCNARFEFYFQNFSYINIA